MVPGIGTGNRGNGDSTAWTGLEALVFDRAAIGAENLPGGTPALPPVVKFRIVSG